MKKIYFLVTTLLLLTGYVAKSQCTNTTQFPSGAVAVPTTNVATTITTCNFAGEYSQLTGAVSGTTLVLTMSNIGTGAYVTVHSGTPSGPIIASGPSPLTFANTFTGTIYAHWSLNAACGTDGSCHTTTVQCSSCAGPPDPCTSITNIPACATNVTTTHSGGGVGWSPGTCGFSTPGEEKIFSFTPTVTGLYNLVVTSVPTAGFLDYFYKPASGGCNSTGWTCIDDNSAAGTDPIGVLTAGVQYYILVDDENTAATSHVFQISCALVPPPNDLCSGAININCGQTITGNTSLGAGVDATAPTCGTTLNTAPGMWYSFTGDGSVVTLSLCGSSYDTKLGVYSGTCAALTCVAGNDDFCGTSSQVTFNTTAGTNYFILVTGFSSGAGAFTLTRTCSCIGVPSPGSISGPSATQCRNSPVTLTLAGYTTGVTGLTFQWNSAPAAGGPYTPIPGATGTTYAFNTSTTTYYTATVTCSNGGGNATTAPFAVNVDGISHTAVSATPSTVCAGGSTTITGTAINGILGAGLGVVATSGTVNLTIPDGNATGVSSSITVPATAIPNAANMRVRVNINHTWVGDVSLRLTSPCGTTFLFDRPGVPAGLFGNDDNLGGQYTFDVTAANIIPETAAGGTIAPGSYRPSDAGGAPNLTWSPLTFPCAAAGTRTLTAIDAVGGDVGTLIDWQLIAPVPGNYIHALTGPGTIVQNPATGPSNATANFTVSNLPAGNQTYTLTTTDPFGCSVSTTIPVTVNALPTVVFVPPSATICNGQIQRVDVYAAPGIPQTYSSACSLAVPGTGTVGNSNPYPCVLNVGGLPAFGVTVNSVTINNFDHTFPDDVDLVLVSPTGVPVILMSDAGGGTPATGQIFTFRDGAPLLADNAFNPTGTYAPTNYGTPDNFPAPGPGNLTQATPTLASFTGNANGNWSLYAVDDLSGDAGVIGSWSITFNIPQPVILTQTPASPNTIFTDATATTPYVPGTPVYTVWVKPAATTTYTGNATVLGCSALPVNMTVTVNQLPTITSQPSPAAQTICPGFTVTYTVGATGAGLTYQWRKNGTNLVNAGFISGVNTPTLTIANVQLADAGSYDVVVSGTCTPPAISNPAVLSIGSPPTISTQPANTTACEGSNATLTVVAAGTPAPTIYQWQQSTDNGVTFTNLTTGGSFTSTLTLSNVTLSMNGYRYRVIITNACGMTITSNVVTLTVNAKPVVTATPLPTRICLSDTLVPLVGSPTGGSWSGVGVSGFNFVPTATAIGTYTLTYSFTSPAGCNNTTTLVAKVEDCPERLRLLSNDGVILFPNPNNGKFNIRINSTLYNYLGMKVYDMQGQLVNGRVVKNGYDQALQSPVFSGLVYGRVVPIDISYLPAGTYLVKFYYDDGIRTSEKGFMVVIMK